MHNVEVKRIRKELIKDFTFKNRSLLFIVALTLEARLYDEEMAFMHVASYQHLLSYGGIYNLFNKALTPFSAL